MRSSNARREGAPSGQIARDNDPRVTRRPADPRRTSTTMASTSERATVPNTLRNIAPSMSSALQTRSTNVRTRASISARSEGSRIQSSQGSITGDSQHGSTNHRQGTRRSSISRRRLASTGQCATTACCRVTESNEPWPPCVSNAGSHVRSNDARSPHDFNPLTASAIDGHDPSAIESPHLAKESRHAEVTNSSRGVARHSTMPRRLDARFRWRGPQLLFDRHVFGAM